MRATINSSTARLPTVYRMLVRSAWAKASLCASRSASTRTRFRAGLHRLLNVGSPRDRDIVLLLGTGLRVSELAGLRPCDLRPDGSVKVTGKGAPECIVPVGKAARQALLRYLHADECSVYVTDATASTDVETVKIPDEASEPSTYAGIVVEPPMRSRRRARSWSGSPAPMGSRS